MNISAMANITRREVRDMIYDWRIMVPIFLLTFILPLMLSGAAIRVINFVEDEGLARRLMPFAVLVVGFIPASFSLITALESFVGERERNSLESLLSMPISDNELYLGKLLSSLLAPILSSYIAMLVFSFLLYTMDSALYFSVITFSRLALIYMTVGLMAIAMVAGAVVISSHINSIRAANLMSSFILVPMALVVQIAAFLIINDHWDVLWIVGAAMLALVVLLVRMGLTTFNREDILSREHQNESDSLLAKLFSRPQTRDSAEGKQAKPRQRHPVLAIARRELNESSSDWRMLIPSFVLTFIIPLGLVSGVDFAVNVLLEEDPLLLGRITPFAILLVGFVPASFSLIIALDSFVGERERNSLESLLAMPVSDSLLYTGKLISSLLPPLVTSLSAMMVFAGAMLTFYPEIYFISMNLEVFIQIILMTTIMTVVMVAGAVIISSHTGSIRAANLMASFVLLPMAIVVQLEAFFMIINRWEVVWMVIYTLAVVAVVLLRTGLGAFNREEILSREHEQINFNTIARTLGVFFREYQPAGVPPDKYRGAPLSPGRFYRHELPALLRDLRLPLVVALVAAVGGFLVGSYISTDFNFISVVQEQLDTFVSRVGKSSPAPSLGLALFVFANNLRVSIFSNVLSSFAFGIFAFLVPAVAFMQIGFITGKLADSGGSWLALGPDSPLQFVLAYVAPHGIIELPTFILSAALGIRIGASIMRPPQGFSVAQNLLWSLANFMKVWLLLLLPLILIASLVEGLISPQVIRMLYAL
jgi:uncharacterized membrane protein SpoIIM required for sporulation/ABC-type Na+ efflux pump permease subunit